MMTDDDTPNATHPITISASERPLTFPDAPDSMRTRTPCHANATTLAILTTADANANPVQRYKNVFIVNSSFDW